MRDLPVLDRPQQPGVLDSTTGELSVPFKHGPAPSMAGFYLSTRERSVFTGTRFWRLTEVLTHSTRNPDLSDTLKPYGATGLIPPGSGFGHTPGFFFLSWEL